MAKKEKYIKLEKDKVKEIAEINCDRVCGIKV